MIRCESKSDMFGHKDILSRIYSALLRSWNLSSNVFRESCEPIYYIKIVVQETRGDRETSIDRTTCRAGCRVSCRRVSPCFVHRHDGEQAGINEDIRTTREHSRSSLETEGRELQEL